MLSLRPFGCIVLYCMKRDLEVSQNTCRRPGSHRAGLRGIMENSALVGRSDKVGSRPGIVKIFGADAEWWMKGR
jgi:hypothetical protein